MTTCLVCGAKEAEEDARVCADCRKTVVAVGFNPRFHERERCCRCGGTNPGGGTDDICGRCNADLSFKAERKREEYAWILDTAHEEALIEYERRLFAHLPLEDPAVDEPDLPAEEK